LTDEGGEVRELTEEDFGRMRPIREVHPELIEAMREFRERNKGGRPKAAAPKVHIRFRLAADVVTSIKASGPNYNARGEQALRKAGFDSQPKRETSAAARKAARVDEAAGVEEAAAAKKRRKVAKLTAAAHAMSKRRA
jgi:uncharacterized protein (DUF4415 family)